MPPKGPAATFKDKEGGFVKDFRMTVSLIHGNSEDR